MEMTIKGILNLGRADCGFAERPQTMEQPFNTSVSPLLRFLKGKKTHLLFKTD